MKKATIFWNKLFFLCLTLCLVQACAWCWPTAYPTGTTLYAPAEAYSGYVLFCPVNSGSIPGGSVKEPAATSAVSLVTMNGKVVHQWRAAFPVLHALLLPNGNVVMTGFNMTMTEDRFGGRNYPIGGATGWLVEQTWDGKTVFEHQDLNMHHDFVKLANGHYLYLDWERVSPGLAPKVRGGIKGSEFPDGTMLNDRIVEIDGKGKVVWEWHANEHLDPKIDIIGPLYKRNEWCHGNSIAVLQNGNILLTSRSLDSILVIDKATGKITFRWGNPSYVDTKTGQIEYHAGDAYLGGPHDGREIPAGYPGAGNFTCYNNRMNTGDFLFSQALEINPTTRQVVWASPVNVLGRRKYSDFLGSTQRLPNGNTLICNGADGNFVQMTPEHKIVWEYINPQIPSAMFNGAVFKARIYTPEYCPQFKTLPPAAGPAVEPATDTSTANATGTSGEEIEFSNHQLVYLILLGVAPIVGFAFGWIVCHKKMRANR